LLRVFESNIFYIPAKFYNKVAKVVNALASNRSKRYSPTGTSFKKCFMYLRIRFYYIFFSKLEFINDIYWNGKKNNL